MRLYFILILVLCLHVALTKKKDKKCRRCNDAWDCELFEGARLCIIDGNGADDLIGCCYERPGKGKDDGKHLKQ